ncbi:hypothetical protein J3A83DRAFT_4087978 [Scleroderma citrinum]
MSSPAPTSTIIISSSPASSGGSSTILSNKFTAADRTEIFWIATGIAVAVSLVQGAITTLIDICESEGLWTIRFSLGRREHFWWTGIALALVASLGCMVLSFLAGNNSDSLGIILLSTASSLAVFRYAWPAWRNRHYCSNRWMAWTGPSRTGIDATLVPLIAGPNPWPELSKDVPIMKQHPVDIRLPLSKPTLIAEDPTDILKAKKRQLELEASGKAGVPGSRQVKVMTPGTDHVPDDSTGLYAPVRDGYSASLQWGSMIGFAPRVSRGILAVPQRLLRSTPLTSSGHDGRAVCLSHGILGRNKGLSPTTFILRFDLKKFEEKSVQWPRPSKVLRSYFREEMESAFKGLGPVFVDAATELTLLLADSSHSLIEDWLTKHMEHQDLAFNNQIARLGASDEHLQLLYRLSYAAMLVSLSAHRKGRKHRPELKIFIAYWKKHFGDEPLPSWTTFPEMKARLEAEEHELGDIDLDALIEAVLG